MYADNFWSGRNVFITGATGLLGSWLTNEIVTKKANVVCLVRDELINTNFDVLRLKDKVTIINGDVENLSLVLRSLNEYEINTIFHLAAQTIVGTANKSPLSTFETNIKGTWNILESARDLDTERVIIASSDKAYGSHEKLPYTEEKNWRVPDKLPEILTPPQEPAQQQMPQGREQALQYLDSVFIDDDLKDDIVTRTAIPDLLEGTEPAYTGVILFGPPGTGKTVLLRAIADVYQASGAYAKDVSVSSVNSSACPTIHNI